MTTDRPPRWPGVHSVRFRITLVATVAVAVVLLLAGVGLVVAQRRSLTQSMEETLAQEADSIVADADRGEVPGTLDPAGDDDSVAQVMAGSTGEVVASTANVAGRSAVIVSPSLGSSTRTLDSVLDKKDHFLFVTRTVPSTNAPLVVVVGAPLDDVADSTRSLARSLLLGGPFVLALLAALVWWLVGRTLRPVESIRVGVSEIGGSDLHRRVPVPRGDDEVARLARTMNDMLERVESSAERQQRFVADASHELRSPLTRIRSELEVDLAHPGGADPSVTHRSVLEEVDTLQRLVDDLLLLARADGVDVGPGSGPAVVVDLDDLVLDEAHRAAGAASGVEVDSSSVSPARVRGDARALGRAVRNVVENATRHAASRVVVSLVARDRRAVLRVADDGPGIPDDRADEVFERFTRLDHARSGPEGGTGLGLAIAKDLVERHHGTIAVDRSHHPGACLVITLPLAPD